MVVAWAGVAVGRIVELSPPSAKAVNAEPGLSPNASDSASDSEVARAAGAASSAVSKLGEACRGAALDPLLAARRSFAALTRRNCAGVRLGEQRVPAWRGLGRRQMAPFGPAPPRAAQAPARCLAGIATSTRRRTSRSNGWNVVRRLANHFQKLRHRRLRRRCEHLLDEVVKPGSRGPVDNFDFGSAREQVAQRLASRRPFGLPSRLLHEVVLRATLVVVRPRPVGLEARLLHARRLVLSPVVEDAHDVRLGDGDEEQWPQCEHDRVCERARVDGRCLGA
eukprot:scaffold96779_cov63-Phaeocystis_antarctica.AAC.1